MAPADSGMERKQDIADHFVCLRLYTPAVLYGTYLEEHDTGLKEPVPKHLHNCAIVYALLCHYRCIIVPLHVHKILLTKKGKPFIHAEIDGTINEQAEELGQIFVHIA